MHNFGILFIWALAACILWQGFFAKGQSGYICLIEDPKQNQYDSICLTELSSRLSEVVKAQNEGNKKLERLEVKIEKTQDKLLQEVQSKLEGQHANMEAKLEDSLLAVKTKLEGQQVVLTKLKVSQAKLEGSLLAVQAKLENQLQAVVNQLQAMSNKMDAAKTQNQGNVCDAVNEIKSKLKALDVKSQLQEVHFKLEGQLQGVENKLEGRLQGLEKQLQEGQTKLEAKLGEKLLAVQGNIENQLQAVLNQLQLVQNKIDVPKVVVPALSTISIPPGFELIGNRYFRIVIEEENWETAERRCREMGGINDQENEGHFVSVASQKPAPFLKWDEDEPNDKGHVENCVFLVGGRMWDDACSGNLYFICQADNEI
ncbi:protein FAM81A-like [Drosophila kikkawai]|uniref:Protein FAM81A-like n=1 Tax=Drosophila kikkawai TaxID=30033 RepID=A0ABM4GA78_DROKI